MTAPQQDRQQQIITAVNGAAYMQAAVTAATTSAIQALWRTVNPYAPQEVQVFTRQAGRLIISSQRAVANAHVAAQQIQLQALGINQPVTVTIPDNVRGATVDFSGKTPKVHAPAATTLDYQEPVKPTAPAKEVTRTVTKSEAAPEKLFERAAETYRYEKSVGTDDTTANTLAEDRIAKLVDDNMILSARLASQQTLKLVADKDDRIVGYRRIIHPELSKGGVCGMCVTAADRMYFVDQLQPIHSRCNCTISPVTKTHDPGLQLNRDDLDKLYVHAKEAAPGQRSTSAAALKRTRYQIDHHHELGPVLTRVTGEDVPYFTPAQAA